MTDFYLSHYSSIYLKIGPATTQHLHVVQAGNLVVFVRSELRLSLLERWWCVVVVVAPARVRRQDSVASANRGLPANWV
jgi:hypothetical protein